MCSTPRSATAVKAVKEMVSRVLRIGSPCEYVLQVKCEGTGLPKGAAKHLLPIKADAVRDNLAAFLMKHKDVCPAELPKTLPPLRGLGDKHHIKLVPGTKPVAKSPYRQAPA